MTYSINIGTDTESTSYNLADNTQFNNILFNLRDNQVGEIDPVDIRNSVLSLWSNCIFKETTTGSKYYIGIDTGDVDNNNDLKRKILIGKRSYNNQDTYSTLNSSDSDIIFYNTKIDSVNNSQTKVSILAGNDSNLFLNAPYISSNVITNLNLLSFDFVNPNGNINISSTFDNVNINNISFPTLSENQISSLNGKVLKWQSGELVWGDISATIGNTLGNPQDELQLFGDVFVNGYSLEFTDSRMVPINLGSVLQGETFGSYAITELLKKIIYSYQSPTCFLRFLSPYDKGFVEIGTTPTVQIEFTINKKTLSTTVTSLQNMIPNTYPPITASNFQTIVDDATAIISPSPIQATTYSFTITVGDGVETNLDTIVLSGVYPIFYGVGVNNSLTYTGMTFLTKLVEGRSNKSLQLLGSGKIYFFYPQEYGTLSQIIDNNSNNIISNFTVTIFNYSSPNGYWTSKQYYIYESISTYSFGLPTTYTFEF